MDGKTIIPIDRINEWETNARSREITKEAYYLLREKLEKKSQYKPLIITPANNEDETYICLAGNHRLRAYKDLGHEELWVTIVKFVQKEDGMWYAERDGHLEKQPYLTLEDGMMDWALTDNEEFASYDKEFFANEAHNYNLDFSKYMISPEPSIRLSDIMDKYRLDTVTDIVEDEAPEVSNEPAVSQLGEVYQLGSHRLMCGDSTSVDDVSKLMDGAKADMVFTDPPYGYKYESNHQDKHDVLLNDDKILDFFPLAVTHTSENAPIYTFCGYQSVDKWIALIKENGLPLKNMIIWKKNNWSMGDLQGSYAGQYEIILYSPKGRVLLEGGRDRDVWEFDREPPTDHPTMKPIELCATAIQNHDSKRVLDLFGGSGSTLIACEQTNRDCYMMELDPKYCDVIRKRYAKFINHEDWQAATPVI